MQAKHVKIGDRLHIANVRQLSKAGVETEEVKELNELCATDDQPHVHIRSNAGVYCRGFEENV